MLGIRNLISMKRNSLEFLTRMAKRDGDLSRFQLGPKKVLLVNEPTLIRDVLVTQAERFPRLGRQLKTIRSIDGNSLFSKTGPAWVADRQMIAAAVSPDKLEKFAADVIELTSSRIEGWCDRQPIDLTDETTNLAALIAGQTMLGTNVQSRLGELERMMSDRSDVFSREMSAAFRVPDHWWWPGKAKKRSVIRTMDGLIDGAINQWRAEPTNPSRRHDLLSVLLAQAVERNLSDRQIRDHLNLLFQASFDDMATAMLWLLFLLASHAEIQQRVHREILDTIGDRPLEAEDWTRLPLLKNCVSEALRLYPTTWLFTARKSEGENRIGQYQVSDGSWIFISPMVTQRDPRFFENPSTFDPDRFTESRFSKLQRGAFFPFGMGPRACAGNRFSMMELVLVAATIAQQFELAAITELVTVKTVPKVTLRPDKRVQIQIRRR